MYTVEIDGEIKTFLHQVKSAGTSIHAGIIEASHNYHNYKVHVNQRHASIRNLPEQYRKYPKYIVLRDPESWYRSFYRFFLGVEGSYSLFLNDPANPPDGYIYPIDFEVFIKRTQNLKKMFLNFPNKARVFRNILRSQGHLHYLTSYFESDFHPCEQDTLEQFNKSLFRWHFDAVGGQDAFYIPMSRLDVIENIFKIKIPYLNKTSDKKPQIKITRNLKNFIRKKYRGWYKLIEEFDENNLLTVKDAQEKFKCRLN